MEDNKDYIGIDIGTSYCRLSIFKDGKVEIIPNEFGKRQTPSYISFNEEEILFGKAAKDQLPFNIKNTFFSIKTLFGKKNFKKDYDKQLTFDIKENPIQLGENGIYTFEVIFKRIFEKLKKNAEQYLGKEVKRAVISIPIYFSYTQLLLLKKVASQVFPYIALLPVTTASAFAYGFGQKLTGEKTVLVFDLGGGFLDTAVLKIDEESVETVAVFGDDNLGGKDFDIRLVEYCANEFKRNTNIDIYQNKRALLRLLKACENAKKILSCQDKVSIELDNLIEGRDFNIVLTREKLENLCIDLFKRCINCIENVIKESKLNKNQIEEIILVGGSSRIPKIRQMIKDFFNGKEINLTINPEEAVIFGIAIKGAIVSGNKDEKIQNLIGLDVSPFSYGIETVGGVMTVLIPKNSAVPCKTGKNISTYADNQTSALINLYEGERPLVKDNKLIETIRIDNIPPLPRGQPCINVSLDIGNGINEGHYIKLIAIDKTKGSPGVVGQNYTMTNLNPDMNNSSIIVMGSIQIQNQNNMNNMNMGMDMGMNNMGMGMNPNNMGMGMNPNNMGMGMNPNNMFGMNYQNNLNMNQFMPQMNSQNPNYPFMNHQNQNSGFGMNYPNNPNFNPQFNQFNP